MCTACLGFEGVKKGEPDRGGVTTKERNIMPEVAPQPKKSVIVSNLSEMRGLYGAYTNFFVRQREIRSANYPRAMQETHDGKGRSTNGDPSIRHRPERDSCHIKEDNLLYQQPRPTHHLVAVLESNLSKPKIKQNLRVDGRVY